MPETCGIGGCRATRETQIGMHMHQQSAHPAIGPKIQRIRRKKRLPNTPTGLFAALTRAEEDAILDALYEKDDKSESTDATSLIMGMIVRLEASIEARNSKTRSRSLIRRKLHANSVS